MGGHNHEDHGSYAYDQDMTGGYSGMPGQEQGIPEDYDDEDGAPILDGDGHFAEIFDF